MDARTPELRPQTATASAAGWRADAAADVQRSLPEVNATVPVPVFGGHWARRLLAFLGPGYLVSVGYMDPGNWATDLAGGSKFGYTLLSVILLSNLMAILLQALAARLGIATDRDLAQACRASFSKPVNLLLWFACEAAIIACDLAEVIGTAIALKLALFINAAILIVAAATFHSSGHSDVAEIGQAFELLSPLLGLGIASTLFAVALLASGLNSTVTATLAGQIVMEGFLHLRLPNWAQRLVTRGIAIAPVIIITALYGERGTAELLVFSQVVLSMQLPFAVIPLVRFVSDPNKMGQFAISRPVAILAWVVAGIIVALNLKLLFDTLVG